ncbi:MAG: 3-isopropylmalate dehydratase small subunit [Eubacteriales bacterium]|nr:3-isopropylmalate dehydratase small subunit [Eubacteriales bacterium]
MNTFITGKVVTLGNNVDTDQIYPGRYLDIVNHREIGKHCLEGVDPAIVQNFTPGDIIAAGTNFGCGSSREHAVIALLNMGAAAVLAESFARIFFRNAVNLGLPLLVCKGISKKVENGQRIELDVKVGTVKVESTGEVIACEKIGDYAMDILNAGGIKPLIRKKMENRR